MIKDTVYVISGIHCVENRKNISKQLDDLGFRYEFIYGIDYNFLQKIQRSVDIHEYKECDTDIYNAKHFSCDLAHYTCIQLAYYNGLDRVIIIEDDVLFHKDKSYIIKIFESIPEDADIAQLGFGYSEYYLNHFDEIDKSILFTTGHYACGGHCYVINNRKTMKSLIDRNNDRILLADSIFNCYIYNLYTTVVPICIDSGVKYIYPYLNLNNYNSI